MAKTKRYDDGGSVRNFISGMQNDLKKAYQDTDAATKHMESMDKAYAPPKKTAVPQDVDGASAGRKFKKNDPGLPEQPGSAIRVDGKPTKLAGGGSASARADGVATKGKTKGRFV